MMKVHRNSKGFTLIELLIVIAIIGILAAVAIPAYTGYTRKAKVQEVIHSMGAVKTAIMAYYTETGVGATATDVAAIYKDLGVDVPSKYATMKVTSGVITATFTTKIGGDVPSGGTIILTPDSDYKNWTWSKSDNMPSAYMPKS